MIWAWNRCFARILGNWSCDCFAIDCYCLTYCCYYSWGGYCCYIAEMNRDFVAALFGPAAWSDWLVAAVILLNPGWLVPAPFVGPLSARA